MKPAVYEHLQTIRRALYSGQISASKVDAQRAFEALCIELRDEPPAHVCNPTCAAFGCIGQRFPYGG